MADAGLGSKETGQGPRTSLEPGGSAQTEADRPTAGSARGSSSHAISPTAAAGGLPPNRHVQAPHQPQYAQHRQQHPQHHISAALAHARSKTVMLAATRQRMNPMLQHIRHVRVEFDDAITPDFVCGSTTAVLYLSLQYHRMHVDYIYNRIRELGTAYKLRVLLILADVDDHRAALKELSRLALNTKLTLVCTASEREAARYCETLRAYDEKTADGIRERVDDSFSARLRAALTSVRGVNKTDVATLAFSFGAVKNISVATEEQLRQCPGLGERKVARLHAAMNQPFKTDTEWNGTPVDDDDGGG